MLIPTALVQGQATGGTRLLDQASWTTTEIALGTDTVIVSSGTVVLDGSTGIVVEFFVPLWAGNSQMFLELFLSFNGGAATSKGYIDAQDTPFSGYASNGQVTVRYPLVGSDLPAAGSYVFSIRGTSSAASVYAGVGGADTRAPGHLLIWGFPV